MWILLLVVASCLVSLLYLNNHSAIWDRMPERTRALLKSFGRTILVVVCILWLYRAIPATFVVIGDGFEQYGAFGGFFLLAMMLLLSSLFIFLPLKVVLDYFKINYKSWWPR